MAVWVMLIFLILVDVLTLGRGFPAPCIQIYGKRLNSEKAFIHLVDNL